MYQWACQTWQARVNWNFHIAGCESEFVIFIEGLKLSKYYISLYSQWLISSIRSKKISFLCTWNGSLLGRHRPQTDRVQDFSDLGRCSRQRDLFQYDFEANIALILVEPKPVSKMEYTKYLSFWQVANGYSKGNNKKTYWTIDVSAIQTLCCWIIWITLKRWNSKA